MMVVITHLSEQVSETLKQELPGLAYTIIQSGHLGVEIFFVLSGFVIAHSIRNGAWDFKYLGLFGLRRSIRLDPPYWVVIILEIGLIYLSLSLFPDLNTPTPDFYQIAAHLVYLQQILGLGHLVPVFWTLCYEVQFYLVFVGSLVLYNQAKNLFIFSSKAIISALFYSLGAVSFLYSISIYLGYADPVMSGLFIDRWFQFLIGVITWWCVLNNGPKWVYALGIVVVCIALLNADTNNYRIISTLAVVTTSLVLYVGSVTDNLSRWLNNRVILFLGSISYSLYLLHAPIGWRLIGLELRFLEGELSLLMATLVLGSGVAVSIFAAWILQQLVEKPSISFAHKIRMRKRHG